MFEPKIVDVSRSCQHSVALLQANLSRLEDSCLVVKDHQEGGREDVRENNPQVLRFRRGFFLCGFETILNIRLVQTFLFSLKEKKEVFLCHLRPPL